MSLTSVPATETRVSEGRNKIAVAPEPGWVTKTKVQSFERKNGAPVTALLSERRIHVPSRTVYTRNVTRLEGSQAVQQLSRVEIPFDPHTTSLVIHSISIFRNGVLTNHADLARTELIRREQRLEAGIVNGELSALILLKDVRIGDVLDVEFSIIDEDSLFAGQRSWIQATAESQPIGMWLLVWIDHRDQPLQISEPGGELIRTDEEAGDLIFRTWAARAVPASEPEPNLPADVFRDPMLQITPFADWAGIAAKLLSKWKFEAEDRDSLADELAAIRQLAADDETALIDAAVATARDAVRYQNYSPGLLAVVPENVSTVWERRFGDCKEKSLLLTWLLRECGIDATPVLVNSVIGGALPKLLPAPSLFDHVVTRIRTGGRTLWVDPTDVYRGGRPSSWTSLSFGWGLALEENPPGLEEIPAELPGETYLRVRETVTASRGKREAAYQFTMTFGGRRADFIRAMVDSQGMAGTLRALKNFMEPTRPGIELDDDPGYDDQRDANIVIFHLTGTSPEAVRPHPDRGPDQLSIAPFTFIGMLPKIERVRRVHPSWLGRSDEIEHIVEVIHSDFSQADYPLQSAGNAAFKVRVSSHFQAGNPAFKFTCVILQDRVPPADIAQYKIDVEKAYNIADVSIFLPRDPSSGRAGPIKLGQNAWRPSHEQPRGSRIANTSTTSSNGAGTKIPAARATRQRRSYQPPAASPATFSNSTKLRFGGFGLVIVIVVVKAILFMVLRGV
jgi:hypothetical protein